VRKRLVAIFHGRRFAQKKTLIRVNQEGRGDEDPKYHPKDLVALLKEAFDTGPSAGREGVEKKAPANSVI